MLQDNLKGREIWKPIPRKLSGNIHDFYSTTAQKYMYTDDHFLY
jgi:hypothetical protein